MRSSSTGERFAVRVDVHAEQRWRRFPRAVGAAGAALLGAAFILAGGDFARLAPSWLVAVLFYTSIALGSLFFVLVQFASRAGWSVVVRRIAENLMGAFPLLGVLFAPLLFVLPSLFEWARPEAVAADKLLQHKHVYLNEPFFILRAVTYFAIWCALAWWFRRESLRQDLSGAHAITRRLQVASGPALIAFALTVTFASFDWMMSLQPRWYSTIFGVYWFAGCVIAGLAALALVALTFRATGLLDSIVTTEHQHDIGKLLFAFVAFWSYIAFSQYFLIWYAGLPEETPFFLARWQGSWRYASLVIGLGHFVAPFFFLLPRFTKRRNATLAAASVWMLLMHYADLYWLVVPAFRPADAGVSLADGALLLGMGGLFFAAAIRLTVGQALIPVQDPRLPESVSFENV